jgi:hypothetical protein
MYISFRVEGLFVLRPVVTSTSSRSSISGLSTKRLTSTLNDIIYYYSTTLQLYGVKKKLKKCYILGEQEATYCERFGHPGAACSHVF